MAKASKAKSVSKKTPVKKTAPKKKAAAVAAVPHYGQYATPLAIAWVALITVFLVLIIAKLY